MATISTKILKDTFSNGSMPDENDFENLIDTAIGFESVSNMLSSKNTFLEGDIVVAEGFRYKVAASDAQDYHITNSATVPIKFYALADFGLLSAFQFGAVGDAVADDTDALNTLFDACRSVGATAYLPEPSNYYLVTESLNMCGDGVSGGKILNVLGDGRAKSRIVGILTESYPICDMSNNKRGSIKGIQIESTPDSLDTCSLFIGEDVQTGANLINISECCIYNKSVNAKASFVAVCVDQLIISENTGIKATGASAVSAFRLDGTNEFAVSSKFITVQEIGGDLTYFHASGCAFTCSGGAAFDVAGYTTIACYSCYFGVLDKRSNRGIIRLDSKNYRKMQPIFIGCRTEDHTRDGFENTDIFHIVNEIYSPQISGRYGGNDNGGCFGGGGTIFGGHIEIATASKLFNDQGPLIGTTFCLHTGPNDIGTIAPGALEKSSNITFTGRVGEFADVMAVFGSVPGLKLRTIGSTSNGSKAANYISIANRVLFPRSDTPESYRFAWSGAVQRLTPNSYIGGGGAADIIKYELPTAIFAWNSGSNEILEYPEVFVRLSGTMKSSWEKNGNIRVRLTQGSSMTDLATLSSVVAGPSGFDFTSRIQIYSESGSMYSINTLEYISLKKPEKTINSVDLADIGVTSFSIDPIFISIEIENLGSNPVNHILASARG